MPHAVGADVATVWVRHFTSVGNLSKIQEGNILLAGDHGCVFAVNDRGQPPSPRDVEKALGISRGRGNAFVDFDAIPGEFEIRVNALTGAREFVFRDDIEQHLDNLRRKGFLRGAETAEISVRLGNYSASHFKGSAIDLTHRQVHFSRNR